MQISNSMFWRLVEVGVGPNFNSLATIIASTGLKARARSFQKRRLTSRAGIAQISSRKLCVINCCVRHQKILFKYYVLAPSYFRLATIIASTRLNFRVRNENGCDPRDEAPEHKTRNFW